jgi:hypothetical protein
MASNGEDPRALFEAAGGSQEDLGGGAYFWVYPKDVKDWTVTLTQGSWSGSMSSDGPQNLQTDGMSGNFDIQAERREPPSDVVIPIEPCDGGEPVIGCNENCASMITLVAKSPDEVCYVTTWDAFCKQ